jgi:hypothetical protein
MQTTDPVNGLLGEALKESAATRFSGVLRVDGWPGATVYLAGGGIAACETPGAPSLEVVLLRSRRVSESAWDAAFAAAAIANRHLTTELVKRELVRAGELEALLRTALADAIFALVSGQVDACRAEMSAVSSPLSLTPAARSGWLLAEATRRVQVLASFPEPAVSAQDRIAVAPVSAVAPVAADAAHVVRRGLAPSEGEAEILALADGRRTARDLAFALGRGLYATLLQLTRMRANGLVVIRPPGTEYPPDEEEPGGPSRGGDDNERTASGLPRRRKDRASPPRAITASVQMLRPRTARSTKPDETL